MKANYKNWVPNAMVAGLIAGTAAVLALFVIFGVLGLGVGGWIRVALAIALGAGTLALAGFSTWSVIAHSAFSYNGKRQLSRQIIEGVAGYVKIPAGGVGLDVGCGSGALAIACAKRNPSATIVGIDHWGKEYDFSKALCESNAQAEGVRNARFQKGDAIRLEYPDECFDAVASNYVYHNIAGHDKQQLLLETLRTLKKGGVFAIHDIMSPARYGDMNAFVRKLKSMGYQDVRLIDTTDGRFMSRAEAKRLMLSGSALLVGKK